MPVLTDGELRLVVEQGLFTFQTRRRDILERVSARTLLTRKNPYLFLANGVVSVKTLTDRLLEAYLSSSEETIFGNSVFEPIALAASGGTPAQATGIDIFVELQDRNRAIAVKSGTSVFNAQSKRKQNENFIELRNRLQKTGKPFDAIVGYAYGRTRFRFESGYIFRQLAGQDFWSDVSGDDQLHLRIYQMIASGHEEYARTYQLIKDTTVDRLCAEITGAFGDSNGNVDWRALVISNSSTAL